MTADQHGPPPAGPDDNEETPPHPWVGPSPEAKAAAEPAKEAVKQAIGEIKTPEQAERVAADVVAASAQTTEQKVREQEGAAPEPAQAIQAAAETTAGPQKAEATLVKAARQVAGSSGETREALEQAIHEATAPEQQGERAPETQEPLALLREAILKQMKPYQAVDARLFLAVNHLPHNHLTNQFMYVVTAVMNAGFGWIAGLTVAAALDPRPRSRGMWLTNSKRLPSTGAKRANAWTPRCDSSISPSPSSTSSWFQRSSAAATQSKPGPMLAVVAGALNLTRSRRRRRSRRRPASSAPAWRARPRPGPSGRCR